MWFAAWWVLEPRLPRQSAADFFRKHLLPGISSALGTHGILLALIDRPSDPGFRPLATGGFFQYRENLQSESRTNISRDDRP